MFGDFVPLNKSYYIRCGVLDLLAGKSDTFDFLHGQSELSSDLESLLNLGSRQTESGTLFRFMQFASWRFMREDLRMSKVGTLVDRPICDDPDIVRLSQTQLLQLDNGTSQWASAAVICGDAQRLSNAPSHLAITYEVVDSDSRDYQRVDSTILSQMHGALLFASTGQIAFSPRQPEDYCFARVFDLLDASDGQRRWPSLSGHESNRVVEVDVALDQVKLGHPVESRDHRVVQAVAMRYPDAVFVHPTCVRKSWPKFWAFLEVLKAGGSIPPVGTISLREEI